MNKRKASTIKIRIDDEMYKQIDELATNNDTSLSEVVRYLIKKSLEEN